VAKVKTQLVMATYSGQRTMEAARGNGYAPAWGSLVMMMMKVKTARTTEKKN